MYWDADADSNYTIVKMLGLEQFNPGQISENWVGRYNVDIPRVILVP